jgi:hypothetical protein
MTREHARVTSTDIAEPVSASEPVNAETTKVDAAIDALLAAHDPRTSDPVAFRGARYDSGLAWIHFAEPQRLERTSRPQPARRARAARRRRAGADHVLHRPRRTDHRHVGHRCAEAALPAA